MSKLDVVIVTGAGRGIGKAAALKLGQSGFPILCISRSVNSAETADRITAAGGRAESLQLDLADYNKTGQVVSDWAEKQGAKRMGVVLAAAILGPSGPLASSDLHEWDRAYRLGVLGNLAVVKALLPGMIQSQFGRIVAFAGGGSAYANPTFPAYSAAKTAMVRIVENLHEDLKDQGDFGVVCLAPGAVETDMLRQVREAGGYVKTSVGMGEPVHFIEAFLESDSCHFSGCFVHVRDEYQPHLNSDFRLSSDSKWKLRRVET